MRNQIGRKGQVISWRGATVGGGGGGGGDTAVAERVLGLDVEGDGVI